MRLVRFVSNPTVWRKVMLGKRDVSAIPLCAISEMIPPGTETTVSLFKMEGVTPEELAAAWWLTMKGPFTLLAVDEADLVAAGLQLSTKEKGNLLHVNVNELHVDLIIKSANDAIKAAEVFLTKGELVPVEDPTIYRQIANDNQAGTINLRTLSAKKPGGWTTRAFEMLQSPKVSIEVS